jgi:hypothetical protein
MRSIPFLFRKRMEFGRTRRAAALHPMRFIALPQSPVTGEFPAITG